MEGKKGKERKKQAPKTWTDEILLPACYLCSCPSFSFSSSTKAIAIGVGDPRLEGWCLVGVARRRTGGGLDCIFGLAFWVQWLIDDGFLPQEGDQRVRSLLLEARPGFAVLRVERRSWLA